MGTTGFKNFSTAILSVYQRCIESKGEKHETLVGPHKVSAYAVGQNLLRIDVKFAVERAWPVEPRPEPPEPDIPPEESPF